MNPRYFISLAIFVLLHTAVKSQILNVDRNRVLTDTAKFATGSILLKFHLDNNNATPEGKNSYVSLEPKILTRIS